MQKKMIDQTGDVLRFSGLRISCAEERYLRQMGRRISRWLPEGKGISIYCEQGEWIYRNCKITDVVDQDGE